ncbi:hypothetical protein MKX03_014439 [Papaver bracteatum]|nr:hypothetical protein MKX03_014439 [Papaver bracteatum]
MGGAGTSSSNESKIPGELLTSNNYKSWKAMMHRKNAVLRRMSQFRGERVNDLRKDGFHLEFIKMSCSAEMLPHIMYAEFAREAWDWLPEAAAWTDLEKEKYTKMIVIAATARKKSDDVPEVDKILTRRNYRKWKIYMKNVLISKCLWTVVDGSDTIISRSYKTKNHHALVAIRMSCGEEMFRYIDEENDASVAWYKLESKLGAATTASPVYYNEVHTFIVADELLRTSSNRYEKWIFCMKNYLVVQELWGFLEETTISDYIHVYILYMDCAKDAWVKLATVATFAPTGYRAAEHRKRCKKVKEAADSIDQKKAAEIRANLGEYSEADEKIPTLRNYRTWKTWEEYVDLLLESRFLGFSSYRIDPALDLIAKACALRIIKEACGREMIPYIFRLKSPGEVFDRLRKACLMDQKDEYMKYSRLLHAVQKNGFREQIQDRNGELWRGAHKFFRDFPEALTAEITEDGSTALHVAVRLGRVNFVNELLKLMNTPESESKTHQGNTAIAVAADGNNMKIVKMLVDKNPDLLLIRNENGLHAVTIAAINGNEMIMRYLYPFTDKSSERWEVKSVASLLTSAARLNAFEKHFFPTFTSRTSLTIYSYLLPEVERVVPPRYKEMKNHEKLTPRSLFSREHNALAKEAEKWMKGMSQACIIVTALIATVMFAAPFTLPGGSDQNTGVSLTLKSRAFKVFMVSDVLSLFASCTSLLIFFSILTARYAEQDFLTSLPRRLILGLFSLFFSIATMMATFTATVVIVFRGEARSRAYIWVSILACIPVLIFALLQYRLFVNLVASTCGRGIFRGKRVVVTPLVSIGYGN